MSGYGGNLIIATGTGGGANSDIIFAANGFTTTDEKFRYVSSTNALRPYGNLAMGLGDSTHWYGNLYVGNASVTSLTASSVNLNTFVVAGPLTLNSTSNAVAIINAGANLVGNIGSVGSQFGNIFAGSAFIGNITTTSVVGANTAAGITVTGNVTITGNLTVANITYLSTEIISNVEVVAANLTTNGLTVNTSATIGTTLGVAGITTVNTGNNFIAIANGGTSGAGNIGASGATFNTVFAKATTAQYADLAEYYSSQDAYPPGTVLDFGGPAEVTLSTTDMSVRVAGVVSTNPAYLMNSVWDGGGKVVALALTGRVPCLVTGNVRAGDMMVSAGNGSARAERNPKMGSVIGKALTDFTGDTGVIEVVVGRL